MISIIIHKNSFLFVNRISLRIYSNGVLNGLIVYLLLVDI